MGVEIVVPLMIIVVVVGGAALVSWSAATAGERTTKMAAEGPWTDRPRKGSPAFYAIVVLMTVGFACGLVGAAFLLLHMDMVPVLVLGAGSATVGLAIGGSAFLFGRSGERPNEPRHSTAFKVVAALGFLLVEIRALIDLTRPRGGPYVTWIFAAATLALIVVSGATLMRALRFTPEHDELSSVP